MICISKRHPIRIRYAYKQNLWNRLYSLLIIIIKSVLNTIMIKMIIMMVIFIGVFTQTCDFVKSWIINLFHLHQGVNIHSTYSHLYHSQSKRCRKRRFVLIANGMRCCVWICSKLGCWWTNRNTERIAKEVNYWVSGVKSGWYDQKQKTKTRLGRCLSYCYWEGVYFFLSRES